MIEKTVRDMVGVLAIISAAEPPADWDKAAAYFYGASGKSDSHHLRPCGEALRQLRYLHRPGGEAAVNTAIGHALTATDAANVIKYIKVLYSQNVLRYASQIDQNMDDPIEIIGEGQAFWRILSPG